MFSTLGSPLGASNIHMTSRNDEVLAPAQLEAALTTCEPHERWAHHLPVVLLSLQDRPELQIN